MNMLAPAPGHAIPHHSHALSQAVSKFSRMGSVQDMIAARKKKEQKITDDWEKEMREAKTAEDR